MREVAGADEVSNKVECGGDMRDVLETCCQAERGVLPTLLMIPIGPASKGGRWDDRDGDRVVV